LPGTSEGIKEWMYKLYYEKESMLEEFTKTGVFPHTKFSRNGEAASKPRPLVHDPIKFLLLHIFFMTSTYIMYKAVMAFYSFVYA
jgi:lysophosphatidylglycerol acyltransferase 1